MKNLYKFTCFFTFLSSISLFLMYIIKFIINTFDYFKTDNELLKSTASALMENNLVTGLLILMAGLAIVSIISLLMKLSNKTNQ